MKTSLYLTALLVALSVGTLLAQGFGARPGTWQFTMTMGGDMPIEGVPPEVAKQLAAQLAKPNTVNNCVTAEDIKQVTLGKMDDGDDEDCKTLSSKITTTTADIVRQCAGSDPYTETAHFEAPTPQTLTANISQKRAKGTTTITIAGKWLAAACKE